MDESQKVKIKAGIFVSVGIIGLILSIFLLAGESTLFEPHYKLYIEMNESEGLARGSVVSLAGLRIGNVRKVEISEETGMMRIELDIRSRYQKNIKSDSIAEFRTAGALGDKFIYIKKGSAPDFLKNGDLIKFNDDPGLFGVITERGAEFEMAFDVLRETKILMESINREQRIVSILKNLDQTSHKAEVVVDQLSKIAMDGKIQDSLLKVNSLISKIESGEGTLGSLIHDPELYNQLREFMGGAPRKQHLKKIMRQAVEQ